MPQPLISDAIIAELGWPCGLIPTAQTEAIIRYGREGQAGSNEYFPTSARLLQRLFSR